MVGFLGFTVTPGSFGFVGSSAGGVTEVSEQHNAVPFTSQQLWAVGAQNPQIQLHQH